MATLGNGNPTLNDLAQQLDPQGNVAPVAEILNESNPIFEDATFIECNDGSGHKSTQRTGLPANTWRKLNKGVAPTKSSYAQVRDACGMSEQYSRVDKALADVSGDVAAYRLNEAMGHIESIGQAVAAGLFYGDTDVNPERFMGLGPRFDLTTAESGDNLLLGGGSGSDNTSIFLVGWHPRLCHFIYPRGSQAGLQRTDKGVQTVRDADGNDYEAYMEHFKEDIGLSVPDWRGVVRIANIDISDLTKDFSGSSADIVDLLDQAMELRPQGYGNARWVIYVNRTIKSFMRRQMRRATNLRFTIEQVGGKSVDMFDGVPIKRCDQIINSEATIS